MNKAFKIIVMTIGAFLITAGYSQANAAAVYEKVELFQTETFFTDEFYVLSTETLTFRATLTDFEFPAPMIDTGMSVTTATDLLGKLDAPGSFTFDFVPGESYFVSFYGFADVSVPQLGQYGIEISQVPVPAAAWLFCSGLIGLIGITRRKKAA